MKGIFDKTVLEAEKKMWHFQDQGDMYRPLGIIGIR